MATKKLQVFKCELCGNIVESIHEGVGELVCCGQPMKLYEENVTDAATERTESDLAAAADLIGARWVVSRATRIADNDYDIGEAVAPEVIDGLDPQRYDTLTGGKLPLLREARRG